MASAADVQAFRQVTKDVTALAYRELLAFWRTLDLSDPVAAVRALEAFLPEVIHAYGEVGASAAADFYDNLREQSPAARRAYSAVMGDAVPIEQIRASTRWAGGPLFQPRADFAEAALAGVIGITDRYVKAAARQTISHNVARDAGARYARVTSGSTCAFCMVLASRGAVYVTEASASEHYHAHCDCVPTPVWAPTDLPDGYDLGGLQQKYEAAKKTTDSGSLKEITAALREQHGIR